MKYFFYLCLLILFTSCNSNDEDVTGFWILDESSAKIGGTVMHEEARGTLLSFGQDYYHIFTKDLIIYMEKDSPGGEILYYEIAGDKVHLYEFRAMQKRKEKVLIVTMNIDSKTREEITVSFKAEDFADKEMAGFFNFILMSTGASSELTLTFKRSIDPPYGYGETADYENYFNMNIENASFGTAAMAETVEAEPYEEEESYPEYSEEELAEMVYFEITTNTIAVEKAELYLNIKGNKHLVTDAVGLKLTDVNPTDYEHLPEAYDVIDAVEGKEDGQAIFYYVEYRNGEVVLSKGFAAHGADAPRAEELEWYDDLKGE